MIQTTSIEALRRLATFPLDAMMQEVGPLALVQRGVESQAGTWQQFSRTVETEVGRPKVARHALSLMELDEGLVVPLGRDEPEGALVLGRGEEADVQVFDKSVSLRHAQVRWDAWQRTAWLTDLGSTNGTLVNGSAINGEVQLAEGNVLSLGDSTAFLFLRTETLYALLKSR